MPDVEIPRGAEDITAAWLTGAIRSTFDAKVLDVAKSPIGTGQIADSIRLTLTWDPPNAGPPTLVAKVTSSSPASRAAGLSTRTYEVEVGFYSDLASELPVRSPRCYWAGFDASNAAYCVLLEDLAPAVQGDQMAGCSLDEAALAVDELALLHGPRWGAAGLDQLPWLQGRGGTSSAGIGSLLEMVMAGFLEKYEHRLSREVVELVPRFVPRMGAYVAGKTGPRTVVHGDFRNDNLMFGGERVCVLDWQTVSLDPAVSDLSYFLGGSLLPDDRRDAERDLLERYRKGLAVQGVDLSADDCFMDYRRYAFGGLIMAIIASALVTRTDRGDDMFVAMADRAGIHALDLESEALLLH